MDTHCNIHARACGCAYRCVDGEEKRERMGKERTYHIRIRRIPCTPGSLTQNTYNRVLQNCCHCYHPFCWNRHGQGVSRGGGTTFFYTEKGLLPPLLSLFYPKTSGKGGRNRRKRTTRRKKETDTNTQKPETGPAMRSPLKDKTPDAAWQGHGYNPTIPRLQPVNTRVTIRRNFSSSPTVSFCTHGWH